jgi:hypothetical protein
MSDPAKLRPSLPWLRATLPRDSSRARELRRWQAGMGGGKYLVLRSLPHTAIGGRLGQAAMARWAPHRHIPTLPRVFGDAA